MHAVAMKPRYLSPDTVPAEALEGECSSCSATPLHVLQVVVPALRLSLP